VYANFVSTIDGIVALGRPESPPIISGQSACDRLVMALLRALADVVVIGAGTLRADPKHRWTPQFIYPDAADALTDMRRHRGRPAEPTLAVVTRSGNIDLDHPGLTPTTMILTGRHGAAKLAPDPRIRILGDETVDVAAVLAYLRADGAEYILSEAGPRLWSQMLAAGCVDELFLTLAPALAGSSGDHTSIIDSTGAGLLPATLMSVRQDGSHLFLRYALRAGGA
jgi:riboflavin biosynthesis pyrimidine reductase